MKGVFDHRTAPGASVHEVETQRRLTEVMSVNVNTGVVVRACQPLRVDGDEIATYTERFDSIHPIYGESCMPVLFHCYGRRAAEG